MLRLRRSGCDANQKSDIPQGMTLTPPLLDLWTKSGSQLDSLLNKEFTAQEYRNLVYALKWQCRLIFESKFWKNFKVNNHHSGVTYGCTDQHYTIEFFFFQSLPRHLANTAENIKNQLYRRWKIVFLIIQRKWPKFKKWVWPVKIP